MKKFTFYKKLFAILVFLPYTICSSSQSTALEFTTGNQEFATIPSTSTYDIGTSNFTIEATVNLSSLGITNLAGIIARRDTGDFSFPNEGFMLGINNSSPFANKGPYFRLADASYFVNNVGGTVPNIVNNQCTHLAVRRDGTQLSLFINGSLVDTAVIDPNKSISHNGSKIYIGNDSTNGVNFNPGISGSIEEVRFWKEARSSSQINSFKDTSLPPSEIQNGNLIGYWKLDDGSGQVLHDSSGTSNDGYLGASSAPDGRDPSFTSSPCTTPLSIDDIDFWKSQIRFTNPVKSYLKINAGDESIIRSVKIYSLTGQNLKTITKDFENINLSEIDSGFYLIQIITDQGQFGGKFIKE